MGPTQLIQGSLEKNSNEERTEGEREREERLADAERLTD